jgi:hypothetical protein
MAMEQQERDALERRLAELEARLYDLEHPRSPDHLREKVKEMGELLRTIEQANKSAGKLSQSCSSVAHQ